MCFADFFFFISIEAKECGVTLAPRSMTQCNDIDMLFFCWAMGAGGKEGEDFKGTGVC